MSLITTAVPDKLLRQANKERRFLRSSIQITLDKVNFGDLQIPLAPAARIAPAFASRLGNAAQDYVLCDEWSWLSAK
jgi:hypothetical protein